MEEPLVDRPLDKLKEEGLSIIVICDRTVLYRSYLGGVRPLLQLVDWFPAGLAGARVADRIVGGCAARILTHLGVTEVLGVTGSVSAQAILHEFSIKHRFDRLVTEIRNRDDTDTCPFEKLSGAHADPVKLVAAIRRTLAELRQRR